MTRAAMVGLFCCDPQYRSGVTLFGRRTSRSNNDFLADGPRGFSQMTPVDITGQLAAYMAQVRDLRLPPDVAQDAKHRILDGLAAIVSGSHLPAGEMAIAFARAQGGLAEATVLT